MLVAKALPTHANAWRAKQLQRKTVNCRFPSDQNRMMLGGGGIALDGQMFELSTAGV